MENSETLDFDKQWKEIARINKERYLPLYPEYASKWNEELQGWVIEVRDHLLVSVSPMGCFASVDLSDYPLSGFYVNRWYYHTLKGAFIAAHSWVKDCSDIENSEPKDWSRNPRTGRRVDGNGYVYTQW